MVISANSPSRGMAPFRIGNRLTVNYRGYSADHRFQGMPKCPPIFAISLVLPWIRLAEV